MGEDWRRRGGRLLVAAALAASTYYLVWGGEYSVFDIRALDEARQEAVERVEILQARVDSVTGWADSLVADTLAIERVARERYGFVRDGERLYRFVEVGPREAGARPAGAPPVDRRNPAE